MLHAPLKEACDGIMCANVYTSGMSLRWSCNEVSTATIICVSRNTPFQMGVSAMVALLV